MNMTLEQFDATEDDALDAADVLELIVLESGDKLADINQWREKCRMPPERWRAAARYLADEGAIQRQGGIVGFGPGPVVPEVGVTQ